MKEKQEYILQLNNMNIFTTSIANVAHKLGLKIEQSNLYTFIMLDKEEDEDVLINLTYEWSNQQNVRWLKEKQI